jgi:hypothetical protein
MTREFVPPAIIFFRGKWCLEDTQLFFSKFFTIICCKGKYKNPQHLRLRVAWVFIKEFSFI